MNILVFNCGSSSLNYKVYSSTDALPLSVLIKGKAHRVGVKGSEPSFIEHQLNGRSDKTVIDIPNHRTAASLALDFLSKNSIQIDCIGQRFVHGGSFFQESVVLDKDTLDRLTQCLPLAPIHNPNSMSVIHECLSRLPGIPEYLTFDTAFHATLPEWSYTYPLPKEIIRRFGFRKFGFHGLSYQFVSQKVADYLGRPLEDLKMVACHLGTGGSSVAAIDHGKSVDTSMGYSPLAGLMMSTRTGDLDPTIPLFMMEHLKMSPQSLNELFNKKSGLLGISGFSSDIRDLIHSQGNARAALALKMYTSRLKETIGAYTLLLNGIDVLVFTDDIGLRNPLIRQEACAGLEWAGIRLDEQQNLSASSDRITTVSPIGCSPQVLSIPTDEEQVIALEGVRLLKGVRHDHH